MYKIGEFSKITMISVKALRYYDREEVLTPTIRGNNQYRMYDENDYEKALLIKKLKKCGFTIIEIKQVLRNYENGIDLNYFLIEKKKLIADNIENEKELIRNIERMILPDKKEVEKMEYKIEVRDLEAVNIAYLPVKNGYSSMGKCVETIYNGIGKSINVEDTSNGNEDIIKAPFSLRSAKEYDKDEEIKLCVPLEDNITIDGLNFEKLPATKALCIQHVGSYEKLGDAYKQLIDYAKENGYELDGLIRETYVKGPQNELDTNSNEYITEIAFPIRKN